ncbi:TetR/AcrR family transcriptional regulator [Actinomadura oligospora]|uniref:TetR/AcrR family transcriptional regulator n=1 Tax=Actinomadura oligospora TaxID=111804 RepID=UPI0014745E0A|nr:TetR/AcrR family transcriptional regulator [Actinomadura oligospora]
MTVTNAEGRRERRRRETRERLLKAALELFGSQGYSATTYDHIAARADVSRQTAFNHFPRKEDFVRGWVELRHRRLTELALAADADAPLFELVASLLRVLASFNGAEGDYALTKDFYDSGILHAVFTDGATVPVSFKTAFERAAARGELRPGVPPEVAAELLYDSYLGTLGRWLAGGAAFPLTETLENRLAVLLGGLTPGDTPR